MGAVSVEAADEVRRVRAIIGKARKRLLQISQDWRCLRRGNREIIAHDLARDIEPVADGDACRDLRGHHLDVPAGKILVDHLGTDFLGGSLGIAGAIGVEDRRDFKPDLAVCAPGPELIATGGQRVGKGVHEAGLGQRIRTVWRVPEPNGTVWAGQDHCV